MVNEPAAHRSASDDETHNPIRVAHVAGFSETSASGVDRAVTGLVMHLDRFGVAPEVWELSADHDSVTERQSGPVSVFGLPAHPRARGALFGLPAATSRFIRERISKIDLLHLHSVFIPDNVGVARIAGLPYVLTPHGGYDPQVLRGRNRLAKAIWMQLRERDYVRGAARVHAVSTPELEQLESTFGINTLMFAPNAVELPSVNVAPQRRMARHPKRIAFLGRLAIDQKGLDVLVKGYAHHVSATADSGTELILAGPDFRSGRAKLQAMAATLLPVGRARFPGPLFGDDKEALLRSAYVFVHTSRWEGMPYGILEALASGCPVLITSATNLGRLVEDFGAGVVVDGTVEGVRDGLARILDLPSDRYEAMCVASRRLASEHFTWPLVAAQIAATYRMILARPAIETTDDFTL